MVRELFVIEIIPPVIGMPLASTNWQVCALTDAGEIAFLT
jgi:hypothetical protein